MVTRLVSPSVASLVRCVDSKFGAQHVGDFTEGSHSRQCRLHRIEQIVRTTGGATEVLERGPYAVVVASSLECLHPSDLCFLLGFADREDLGPGGVGLFEAVDAADDLFTAIDTTGEFVGGRFDLVLH